MLIKSPDNPRIKLIQKLYKKKKERDRHKLFIIEGHREIRRALKCHLKPHSFYQSAQNPDNQLLNTKQLLTAKIPQYRITAQLFPKISYRQNPVGILGIFHQPKTDINDIDICSNPFLLVIESPEKPGNVGALLRSADATGVNAIIISDPDIDLFNPNVIRAACGAFFSRPVYISTNEETIKLLQTNKIKIIATTPDAKKLYHQINYNQPIAITAGSEDRGLSDCWLDNADYKIKIPMQGIADSLNLSVSTGIVLYEALKHRM